MATGHGAVTPEALAAARETLRAAGVPVVEGPVEAPAGLASAALGELGAMIAVRDWAATPLGPTADWPPELWTAIRTCLPSRIPMLLWWGPELVQLYNDADAPVFGAKHPVALGQPAAQCWAEAWEQLGPMAADVLAGRGAVHGENLPVLVDRHGYVEETYWTFSYSPIHDLTGAARGIFVASTETTAPVLAERRLGTLHDLGRVAAAGSRSVAGVLAEVAGVLGDGRPDLPFVAAYLAVPDGSGVELVAVHGAEPHAVVPRRVAVADDPADTGGPEVAAVLRRVLRDGGPQPVALGEAPGRAVVLPLCVGSRARPSGLLVLGVSPRRELDKDYRTFFDLVAARVATLLGDAIEQQTERRRAEREGVVGRSTAGLLTATDVESILALGMDGLRALVGTPVVAALTREGAGRLLVRGDGPAVPDDARPALHELMRHALDAPGGPVRAHPGGPTVPSGLLVTVDVAEEPAGVGSVLWTGPLPARDADTEASVALLAARVAQALQRTRHQRRVAALSRVAVAIAHAESVADVADLVVEQGLAALSAEGGAVAVLAPGDTLDLTIESLGARTPAIYGRLPRSGPLPASVVTRTREPVLLADRAAALAFAPEMGEVIADTGCQAWASFPLLAGDAVLGSLTVGWVDPHAFPDTEVELLAAFAAQCAHGLTRIAARETERAIATSTRRLAETLQTSMLTEPVAPEHLQVAVRYRSAAREARIGGDWYDAFPGTTGELNLVVGDVAGHDRAAAAAMGQARNLLRGLAFGTGAPPAEILAALDRALRHFAVGTLATAVLGRVEQAPDDAHGRYRLRWASAGHPPPLLVTPDGAVRLLRRTPVEVLLGVTPELCRTDHEEPLPAGSTVLLYTDGLFERRGQELDEGLAALVAAARSCAELDLESFCDAVLDLMELDGDDDVALLAVRPRDPG